MKTRILLFVPLLSILLVGCCGEIKAGEQNVNVSPLYDLGIETAGVKTFSDVINIDSFLGDYIPDNSVYRVYRDISELGGGTLSIGLLNTIQQAHREFASACAHLLYKKQGDIIYGGETGNQYCFSYIREMRSSTESFCRPTGEYTSYAVFQKDRLVIEFRYYSDRLDSSNLDEAIVKVSEAFK